MPAHHCHALGCSRPCPPKYLMCREHWRRVPPPLQAEVYRTVKLRGRHIDATWAPWWKAQAEAIAYVAHSDGLPQETIKAYMDREMRAVERFKGMT